MSPDMIWTSALACPRQTTERLRVHRTTSEFNRTLPEGIILTLYLGKTWVTNTGAILIKQHTFDQKGFFLYHC